MLTSTIGPDKELLAKGVVTIHLGGQDWPVLPLAIKQNKIVTPLLMKLLPQITKARDGGRMTMATLSAAWEPVTFDQLEQITFETLKRSHPRLTREQFEELPISALEMISAINVIGQMTGLFSANQEAGPGAATGESGSQTTQTSTQS